MWSQFRFYRTQLKVTIHDKDFAMQAMGKAFEVGISYFKASSHFILDIEYEYKITSRRKTHPVTKINLFIVISLQPIIDESKLNFKKWFTVSYLMNTDENGFTYEIVSKRTLDFRGSKQFMIQLQVKIKQRLYRNITIQITINPSGNFIGSIVLQEFKVQIFPIIMQKLAKISTPNLLIRYSMSGKNTKQLTGEQFEKIRECIARTATILVLDKWSYQPDEGVYIEKFDFSRNLSFFHLEQPNTCSQWAFVSFKTKNT